MEDKYIVHTYCYQEYPDVCKEHFGDRFKTRKEALRFIQDTLDLYEKLPEGLVTIMYTFPRYGKDIKEVTIFINAKENDGYKAFRLLMTPIILKEEVTA